MFVISALLRLRQEDHWESNASLVYKDPISQMMGTGSGWCCLVLCISVRYRVLNKDVCVVVTHAIDFLAPDRHDSSHGYTKL